MFICSYVLVKLFDELFLKASINSGCLVACSQDIWAVTETNKQNIFWKTNWTSEFFLEAKSPRIQVYSKETINNGEII